MSFFYIFYKWQKRKLPGFIEKGVPIAQESVDPFFLLLLKKKKIKLKKCPWCGIHKMPPGVVRSPDLLSMAPSSVSPEQPRPVPPLLLVCSQPQTR